MRRSAVFWSMCGHLVLYIQDSGGGDTHTHTHRTRIVTPVNHYLWKYSIGPEPNLTFDPLRCDATASLGDVMRRRGSDWSLSWRLVWTLTQHLVTLNMNRVIRHHVIRTQVLCLDAFNTVSVSKWTFKSFRSSELILRFNLEYVMVVYYSVLHKYKKYQ